ncbi:cell wall hydrolase [Sphingobium boeckii]|uniref:Spore germination cell wall hydrolase CwlJ-like protein n=1 Tax=Sphingobium boeckii TaxID=1082345 RepID=A0A7W9AJN1_9SPHN|nr:cell wall hydrolase [Sphingobium boeckii]MBB5686924.1 spore germination cell wall hydrolase CwlJ-like protein [Sphingobium boeckii]
MTETTAETAARRRGPNRLAIAMLAVFALGLAGAIWAAFNSGKLVALYASTPATQAINEPARTAPPPPVEPLVLKQVAPEDAVAINARVAFSTAPNPPARPFAFTGNPAALMRATDCLAAAMLYEAGGSDVPGQRAVAQVVLNRVRHPAFPKSVCDVVFQGQERSTGCQFTFTCDGALARAYDADAWTRARKVAAEALGGSVFAKVGTATHYHTDWVVPYWSGSLDKIAAVGTHLFFRWTGWWGTPAAFRGGVSGGEPVVPRLAAYSEAHRSGLPGEQIDGMVPALDAANVPPSKARSLMQMGETFIVTIDPKAAPDSFTSLAIATCGARPYCKFMAWADKDETPKSLPIDPQIHDRMAFSYLRMKESNFEKSLWNCAKFPRPGAQCIRGTIGTAPKGNAVIRRRPGVAGDEAKPAQEKFTIRRRPDATGTPEVTATQ